MINLRSLASVPGLALMAIIAASLARADGPTPYVSGTTPKGIPFLHRHDPATPFAAINLGMRDTYAAATPGKEGLVSLGSSLILGGADASGSADLIESLKDLAASAFVSIGPYSTLAGVRAPTVTLAPATALLADALKRGRPTDKLVTRLRQRLLGAEAQATQRAETIAYRTAMLLALGDHPVTRGFAPARLERIDAGDLDAWRRASLTRDRLKLVSSGRISAGEAAAIIDDSFADLPEKGTATRIDWPKATIPAATVVVEHDTPQSAVLMLGLTSIGPGRELEQALVANAVLGASSGSRLWHAVRAGLGSTYGASSGFQLVGPGMRVITLRGAIANDQVKASLEALKAAYATWRERGLTDAEIKTTTTRMITDFRSALDEPSRANGLVVGMQLASRPVEDLYGYEARLARIDRAGLNAFVTTKFPAPERLLTVIVTPRADGLGATCIIRGAEQAARCREPAR